MSEDPDYRLYLEEKFAGISRLVNAQFEVVHERLDAIKEQTTKTNGRVNELEDDFGVFKEAVNKELPHTTDSCPHTKTITDLRDNMVTGKTIRNTIVIALTGSSAIAGIFWIFYKVFINQT
jgi:hypothetical protein